VAIVAGILLFNACAGSPRGFAAPYGFISYPTDKVRPFEAPAASLEATVRAAGNEWECALFGLFNPGPASIRIESIGLSPVGVSTARAELFLVGDYVAEGSSRWFDPPAVRGAWPDPLIPLDADAATPSYAFEGGLELPMRTSARFLVDFRFAAGRKEASDWIAIATTSDGAEYRFAFSLVPYAFDLPRARRLATSANLSIEGIASSRGLDPRSQEAGRLYLEYREEMLDHGLSPYYAGGRAVPFRLGEDGLKRYALDEWLDSALPYLRGEAHPALPLPSSFFLPVPIDGDWDSFLPQAEAAFVELGVDDRAFHLLIDEPLASEYPAIRALGERFKRLAPSIRTMLTDPYSPALEDAVDIFCPDAIGLGDSLPANPIFFRRGGPVAEWQPNPPPDTYARRARAGYRDWFYSCNSAQLYDVPNVFIDSVAAYQRSIGWLAYRYGFSGFLYWHVNVTEVLRGDAWTDQRLLNCHGDGNLFYTGGKATRWLWRDAPVPSLRLKLLREGFDDYEYLAALAATRLGIEADGLARGLVRSSIDFEKRVDRYLAVRERAAILIEQASKELR
jgi:hypothetical protein